MGEYLFFAGLIIIGQLAAYAQGRAAGRRKQASMGLEWLRYFKHRADEILRNNVASSTELEFHVHFGGEVLACSSRVELAQVSLAVGEILGYVQPDHEAHERKTA